MDSNKLQVNSHGAKIIVSLNGTSVLGDFVRGDGKQGITHPCTPIFGPDRNNLYGLKQHGDMRNSQCMVQNEAGKYHVSYEIQDQGYPSGVKVEQMMEIQNNEFCFVMTHTNTGNNAAAVNAGEHCYFDAPEGFAGTTVNGIDITKLIEENYDGIAVDLLETNSIKIPGKPEYTLTQQGLKKAVVWVGKNPETKAIDTSYICIEPVEDDPFGSFFGSAESMLRPGQSRTFTLKLTIK